MEGSAPPGSVLFREEETWTGGKVRSGGGLREKEEWLGFWGGDPKLLYGGKGGSWWGGVHGGVVVVLFFAAFRRGETTVTPSLQEGDGLGLLGREGLCGRGGLGVGL